MKIQFLVTCFALLSLLTACGGEKNQATPTSASNNTTNSDSNNEKEPSSLDTLSIDDLEPPTSVEITPPHDPPKPPPPPKQSTTNQTEHKSKSTPNIGENIPVEPEPEPLDIEKNPKIADPIKVIPAPEPTPTPRKPQKPSLSHDIFDGLLQKYVNSSGRVNYAAMQKEKQQVAEYIMVLQNNPPQSSWSKNKKMAYWINLYNAFTIQSILQRYPVSSIMDLHGGNIWDKATVKIAGKNYTLNQIEKEILIKGFNEPRVHFAVNCAAASCPPLLNRAWTEANIQRNFEKSAKAFINNSNYNELSAKSVKISKIFEWYAGDFGGNNNLIKYLNKYANTPIKDNAKISYLEYDWKLNKQ